MLKKMALKLLLKKWNKGNFSVIFWDGEKENFGQGNPSFTLKFNQEPSWQLNNDDIVLTLGEAYMDGIIDLEGSMDEVLRVITENSLPEMKNEHTIANKIFEPKIQKQNIHRHYDLGNDFFSLWLDKTMSYSCAYFKTQKDTLEQAQLQKIDHTLKKLNLKPDEELLDIGSGWGWLIIRAAQQYHVKATGITLSTEQYDRTKEQIQALGLENQVKVYLTNYQELDSDKFQFNKIVSVGMFEHVGKGNHNQYMKKVHELLVPGGISLLHTITGMFEEPGNSWMKKYIFPGGYVPSLRETIWALPEYDFHLLHLESLRLHYALTLDYWYNNFLEHIDEIRQKYGERFVRMWSLYLQGCAAAFRVSGLDVHQLLFTKGLNNDLPLTYNFIYNQK
ncbi:cyclopropane-fatty-acyl-phospholipid synthase [Sporomusaceae bacterium BoRhaA]|uniref:SAM-dependent methyltransferase n=1 Tax=Pelorhabdus rhamnosifermentans TaxID=2772457 RepID=UPI001C061FE3|nr:cyclopropane-fatty-acyl-phospholipid synthase family protein [Pelorhabdus rhamnosifermentans]MBU2699894.1 cyclopropane-fatty-acyl-phospholipid synthase [Pelorhabdus rhamnosifermentans]